MKDVKFEVIVSGISDFNEQCRVQCSIQNTISELGYPCGSMNYKVVFK